MHPHSLPGDWRQDQKEKQRQHSCWTYHSRHLLATVLPRCGEFWNCQYLTRWWQHRRILQLSRPCRQSPLAGGGRCHLSGWGWPSWDSSRRVVQVHSTAVQFGQWPGRKNKLFARVTGPWGSIRRRCCCCCCQERWERRKDGEFRLYRRRTATQRHREARTHFCKKTDKCKYCTQRVNTYGTIYLKKVFINLIFCMHLT